MSRLKKLNAFLITLLFSHFSAAVIVEGPTYNNKVAALYATNSADEASDYDDAKYHELYIAGGSLDSATQLATQHNSTFAQNIPLLSNPDIYDNVVSYAGLETSGIANRVDYHGWMVSELPLVEVATEEVVTVPEPSPVLLMIAPLLLLFWRAKLLTGISRKSN